MYNRQNMEKRQRFSIRKLTVGTCSVIIGAFFFGTLQPVSATEAAATEVVATAVENTPASEVAATAKKFLLTHTLDIKNAQVVSNN